jgi:DNA-binding CsgD family transcriptional regulator
MRAEMKKAIYIVGAMKMQNSVMAAYLRQITDIQCEAVEDALRIPDRNDGTNGEQRLILWDCMGADLETCLSHLSNNGGGNLGRDLLGLFNLNRGEDIEEDSLVHGVSGVFSQGDSIDQFMKGIQAIFEGELWLSRKVMTRYILNTHKQSFEPSETDSKLLTAREKEILTMLSEGGTNEQIADKLCVSRHTVKTHLYNIFKKINATSRFQAALWAAKNLTVIGLIYCGPLCSSLLDS